MNRLFVNLYPSQGLVKSDSRDTLNRDTVCRLVIYIISMSGSHEYIIVHSEKLTVGTPLIPRIESAKVGSKSLPYLIRPGSDFWGDRIRCDTGSSKNACQNRTGNYKVLTARISGYVSCQTPCKSEHHRETRVL